MARSADFALDTAPTRYPRWLWLFVMAVVIVIAGGAALDRWRVTERTTALDPSALRPGYGSRTFAEAMAIADRSVANARESLQFAPREWLRQEGLARALIARYRLGGSFDDLAEADRRLDEGLSATPDPAGPALTKAILAGLVHRTRQTEIALARVERAAVPDAADLADVAALRGDIALQRGDLAGADRLFARAQALAPGAGIGVRQAVLAAQSGRRADARRQLEALLAKPRQPPSALAETMLIRANFAYWAGDWDDAGRWVGAAQRAFPGYWLADAYAAQQFALAGRTDEAIRAYRIVAERSGRPEAMDALAHLLRLQGQAAASKIWAARVAAGWEQRGRLFPEAVAHHRAEHELAVGSAVRARSFAAADAAARPQAPNLVLLARAELLGGRPQAARALLERAERQGWVSAGQEMARAEVAAALGDAGEAEAARKRAEAINPRAADPRTRLIWFGHD